MPQADKSLESWIWDAACSIRGAKDAPKYKDYILPLIFTKRLCDVFDDELNRIAKEVGSRAKAFKLVKHDKKLVRFYLPLKPNNPDELVWTVIRKLADKIGEQLTTYLRAIADDPCSKASSIAWTSTLPRTACGIWRTIGSVTSLNASAKSVLA
jgi:type I restriction enzyme M protein